MTMFGLIELSITRPSTCNDQFQLELQLLTNSQINQELSESPPELPGWLQHLARYSLPAHAAVSTI